MMTSDTSINLQFVSCSVRDIKLPDLPRTETRRGVLVTQERKHDENVGGGRQRLLLCRSALTMEMEAGFRSKFLPAWNVIYGSTRTAASRTARETKERRADKKRAGGS